MMKLLIATVSRQYTNKAHFNDLNAYHHAIYDGLLHNYGEPEYKFNQTKLVNNSIYTVGLAHGVSILRNRLDSVDPMHLIKGKKRKSLYAHIVYENECELNISDRPHLYQLAKWDPLKEDDKAIFHMFKEMPGAYEHKNAKERLWRLEELRFFLEQRLLRDLHHWLSAIEHIPSQDFYVSIQPQIISSYSSNHHAKRNNGHSDHVIFDIYFTSNLEIPSYISIGNQMSIGYGTITQATPHTV